ncbi:MAG: ribosome maturation factor RimP [Desulfobacca sp.]|uniref:ribosome maturation factor RimP n=1 Tax=Desulfobacca sp. TaxID=2067990 RepID=UPI004049D9FA
MKPEETVARVNALILPVLQSQGVELVETEFVRAGRRAVLRLFVDKPGGITLDDCAALSQVVGEIIDVHEVIGQSYVLEVSSPGLTRPLKKAADYQRFKGRQVRLTRRAETGKVSTLRGELLGLDGEEVLVQVGSQVQHVPLTDIVRARLDPDLFGGASLS